MERAVRLALFRHCSNVQAQVAQDFFNMHCACAVQRCVNNFYVFCKLCNEFRSEKLRFYHFPIRLVDFLVNHDELACFNCLVFADCLYACYGVYFVDDADIVRLNYLCAVVPICLIAVILRRVVRSCNYNACVAAQFSDGKRKLRCRAETCKKISLEAVSCKYQCSRFCKYV